MFNDGGIFNPSLINIQEKLIGVYSIIADCYRNGGKLLIAGNGGLAADAEHIVGELMKSFVLERKIDQDVSEKLVSMDAN